MMGAPLPLKGGAGSREPGTRVSAGARPFGH